MKVDKLVDNDRKSLLSETKLYTVDMIDVSGPENMLDWIPAKLKIPAGPRRGEAFVLDDWQRRFLEASTAPGIQEAGLSVSRKNGKTGIVAALCLGYLICPTVTRPDWRGVVTSLTGNLAQELRRAIAETADVSGFRDIVDVGKTPTPGYVAGPDGARVDFVAADKAGGHSRGADLAIVDELGLLDERKRELVESMYSSISSREGKFVGISVRGDSPMLNELAERADKLSSVVFQEYTAPPGCDVLDEDAWHAANPGLRSGVKSLTYMRAAAERAAETPASESSFRNLDLNQPGSAETDPILAVSDWTAIEAREAPERAGRCVLGVDLGGSASMTAAAALWESGRCEVWGAFPAHPPLSQRGRTDGVGALYARLSAEGELWLMGERVVPVGDFLRRVLADLGGSRVVAIGADRHRKAELQQALSESRLSVERIAWRGTGASPTADGSHDVRAFQRLALAGPLGMARGKTLLALAIAGSKLRYDGAGNPALDKAQQRKRIDPLSAAVIAAGLRELLPAAPARTRQVSLV